jgi:hypothetical protein
MVFVQTGSRRVGKNTAWLNANIQLWMARCHQTLMIQHPVPPNMPQQPDIRLISQGENRKEFAAYDGCQSGRKPRKHRFRYLEHGLGVAGFYGRGLQGIRNGSKTMRSKSAHCWKWIGSPGRRATSFSEILAGETGRLASSPGPALSGRMIAWPDHP